MLKLIRNVLLCAAVAPLMSLLTADSADAQSRTRRTRDYRQAHTQYWNGYWGWYDNSYRPYWNQRYRTHNRGFDRSNAYRNGRYDRRFNRPRRGGSVNIGPLQFGYTQWY